jgi:hypothetical protein
LAKNWVRNWRARHASEKPSRVFALLFSPVLISIGARHSLEGIGEAYDSSNRGAENQICPSSLKKSVLDIFQIVLRRISYFKKNFVANLPKINHSMKEIVIQTDVAFYFMPVA